MPSLQLDVPRRYDADVKRSLAQRMGIAYARIIRADVSLVTVSTHDQGPGGVWRCTATEPEEAALIMCDIRSGRSAETRGQLARALIAIVVELGDLADHQVKVQFTQHSGDEMFHPHLGGFNRDWSPDGTDD